MEENSGLGIFMIIHHNGSYSFLFAKRKLQSFEISCELFL